MNPELGLYRHYKGGLYLLIAIGERHTHNGDLDAIYISLLYGKHNTRPLHRDSRNEDSWTDLVEWPDHVQRPRFELQARLDDANRITPSERR